MKSNEKVSGGNNTEGQETEGVLEMEWNQDSDTIKKVRFSCNS